MNLRIVTPLEIAVDVENVASLTAVDESGSFGILPGHSDFLTALSLSVVAWRREDPSWHFCAVRGGVLRVVNGQQVTITSREAVTGDDLDTLDETVLTRFRAETETERAEHAESTRLQLAAIRQIMLRLGAASGRERAI